MSNFNEIIDFQNNEGNQKRISDIVNDGYEFNFSKYLEEGFSLVNKDIGSFVGYTLVFFLIYFVSIFIPIIGVLAAPFITLPILGAGYYFYLNRIDNGQSRGFENFFDGFKGKNFGNIVSGNAIVIGIAFLILIPFIIYFMYFIFSIIFSLGNINSEQDFLREYFNNLGQLMLVSVLMYIPMIYIMISFVFTTPMAIFYKDGGAWDKTNGGRKIITKKWFHVFGLLFILGIFNLIGALICGLGLLYTIPLSAAVIYSMFKDIVGFYDNEDTVIKIE